MSEDFWVKSISSAKHFNLLSKDIIRIMNPAQAAFYVFRGCELLRVQQSLNRKDGSPCFVYLFSREDTAEAYDEWCSRKEPGE